MFAWVGKRLSNGDGEFSLHGRDGVENEDSTRAALGGAGGGVRAGADGGGVLVVESAEGNAVDGDVFRLFHRQICIRISDE